MPDLKVFLDDTLLISTPVNLQQIPPKRIKPRSVSFGPDQITTIEGRITKQDLRQVFEPEIDKRYYYFKDNKIKEGQYYGYDDELAKVSNNPYMMIKDDQTPNSIMDFADAVYINIKTSSGGKRKSRRTNRRKTNKRINRKRRSRRRK